MPLRVGIDTGGTFTDVVAVDGDGNVFAATKTPSTPDDPSRAVLDGLDKVLALLGRSALRHAGRRAGVGVGCSPRPARVLYLR